MPDFRSTAGNLDVYLLERPDGDVTHFIPMTFWDDLESIRAFAGADVTAAKYYRWEVNNMTKMTRVQEAAQVGGHWRPVVVDLQDLGPGGDTTTITFAWQAQPDLPAAAFTPTGLATAIPR